MNSILSYLSLLQVDGAVAGQDNQLIWTGVTFGAIILIFYFMIIRPQNKRQKEAEKMLTTLKRGDKVVTIGGLRGEIQDVKTDTVVLKVDPDSNAKLEFTKSSIASVINPDAENKIEKK